MNFTEEQIRAEYAWARNFLGTDILYEALAQRVLGGEIADYARPHPGRWTAKMMLFAASAGGYVQESWKLSSTALAYATAGVAVEQLVRALRPRTDLAAPSESLHQPTLDYILDLIAGEIKGVECERAPEAAEERIRTWNTVSEAVERLRT